MRHPLLISAGSIVLGWVVLFGLTYLVERPLLQWTAPLLGASWLPTVQLALACCGLAATGWIMGRWNRSCALPVVLIFAAMLAIWNFDLVPIVDVRWLIRLMLDSFENSRYLESLITALATDALLFGSLFVGSFLSRAREQASTHLFPPSL